MKSICHISSVHPRYDIRIFRKELLSLSRFYNCHLLVCDSLPSEVHSGIAIHAHKPLKNRLFRILFSSLRLAITSLKVNADVYHIHDPELLPLALLLLSFRKRVVYDAHEDIARQILYKPYLPVFLSLILYPLLWLFCFVCFFFLRRNISATSSIASLKYFSSSPAIVRNYPIVDISPSDYILPKPYSREIVYVGAISRIRGVVELIRALEHVSRPVTLNLIGTFNDPDLYREVLTLNGWSHVNFHGQLSFDDIKPIFQRSFAGCLNFHPVPNHVNALPNKLFEYMLYGLPVIASNFPGWSSLLNQANSGILVNPLDPKSIAAAIDDLSSNPSKVFSMATSAQHSIITDFNWSTQESQLLQFYNQLFLDS